MASKKKVKAKRDKIRLKINKFLDENYAIFTISISNVSSNTIKQFRLDMSERGIQYMFCKNAVMRKLLSNRAEERPQEKEKLQGLIDIVKDNVTFLFIPREMDLFDLKKQIENYGEFQDGAVGRPAPNDVIIPKGHVIDHDGVIGSLQLGLPLISAGNVTYRLTRNVLLRKKGDLFTQSDITLLNSLRMKPCFYQLKVVHFHLDGQAHLSSELCIDLNSIRASVEELVASLNLQSNQWHRDDLYIKKLDAPPVRYRLEPKYPKR